jgi:hypothetical protein
MEETARMELTEILGGEEEAAAVVEEQAEYL